MKNSKFKHYLIPDSQLQSESKKISTYIAKLPKNIESWELAHLSYFLLVYFFFRAQGRWYITNAKQLQSPEEILNQGSFSLSKEWFLKSRILKIPGAIHELFQKWEALKWPLLISDKHFSPFEIMQLQAEGKRVVTIDLKAATQGDLVDGKRDAFEFVLHDLMHAYHFFENNDNYLLQVQFFKNILNDYQHGDLKKMLELDPEFKTNIEYVMSDMNTNIYHLKSTYRAHLINYKYWQADPILPDHLLM